MKDPDFAVRLTKASDEMREIIPEHGNGRHRVISRKLDVSPEAVRRWFAGEARPRVNKLHELARLLRVDPAWLSLGVEPEMRSQEKRLFGKQTDGIVYFALGLTKLEGLTCSQPDANDPRGAFVDYYMINDGTQVPIRTALARELKKDAFEFLVPHEYGQVTNVGFVFHSNSRIHMLNMTKELIEAHKKTKGSGYAVTVELKNGKYVSDRDEWPRIQHFGDLS